MADSVENTDSFDGSIEYHMRDDGTFDVAALYRVGNSVGQGGCILIGQAPHHTPT